MSLFDDLIPRSQPQRNSLFADLIPQDEEAPRLPQMDTAAPTFGPGGPVEPERTSSVSRRDGRQPVMQEVEQPLPDFGRRAARGITEVIAGVPEAIGIMQSGGVEARIEDTQGGISVRDEQIQSIQERLADPAISGDERRFREQQLSDLTQGQEALQGNMQVLQERAAIPTQERPVFKAGDAIRERSTEMFGAPDPQFDDRFGSKLAEGAGSLLGFAATTALTGWIGGAATGAALNSASLYNEAIDSGASEEEARRAAAIGAAIGTTEVIPIGRALDRFTGKAKSRLSGAISRRLASALETAGEEGVQEAAVTIANNLTAAGIYDPDRQWSEGALESAAIGAVLGGGLGALTPAPATPRSRDDDDRERPDSPRLTPGDRASPLPNDIIDDGKAALDDLLSNNPQQPQAGVAPLDDAAPNVRLPEVDVVQRPLPTDRLSPTLGAAPQADVAPTAPTPAPEQVATQQPAQRLSEPMEDLQTPGRMVRIDLDTGDVVPEAVAEVPTAPVQQPAPQGRNLSEPMEDTQTGAMVQVDLETGETIPQRSADVTPQAVPQAADDAVPEMADPAPAVSVEPRPTVSRERLKRRPLTDLLKVEGVQPGSPLATELAARGIDQRTTPGLFKAGGRVGWDNLPVSEWSEFAPIVGEDGNGYLSRDGLIEAVENEMRGQPVQVGEQARLQERRDLREYAARFDDDTPPIDLSDIPEATITIPALEEDISTDAERRQMVERSVDGMAQQAGLSDVLTQAERRDAANTLEANGGNVEDVLWGIVYRSADDVDTEDSYTAAQQRVTQEDAQDGGVEVAPAAQQGTERPVSQRGAQDGSQARPDDAGRADERATGSAESVDPRQELAQAKADFDRLNADRQIEDAQAYFAASRRLSSARQGLADKLTEEGGRIELANSSGNGATITPTGDGYQISYFDNRGFSGDTRHDTLQAAVRDAVGQGYDTESPGLLKQKQKGADWQSPAETERARREIEERMSAPSEPATEQTDAGEQTLMPGVAPITEQDRQRNELERRANAPIAGRDFGPGSGRDDLFGAPEDRRDLFDAPQSNVDQEQPVQEDNAIDDEPQVEAAPDQEAPTDMGAAAAQSGDDRRPPVDMSSEDTTAWLEGFDAEVQRQISESKAESRDKGGEVIEGQPKVKVTEYKPAPNAPTLQEPQTAQPYIKDFGEKIGGARKDTAESTGSRGSRASTDNRPAWRKRYAVMENWDLKASDADKSKWMILDTKTNKPVRDGFRTKLFDSEAQAEAAIPLYEVARNHKVYADGENGFQIVRLVSDRKRPTVKTGFATREEATEYMATNAVGIIETKTRIDDSIHPALEEAIRIGEERREGGRDVVAQDFGDIFGFRGVEFGNWNNGPERQHILNQAYDAFLDMAEIIRVPPKALSLNGELALAFGARGQGLSSAKAHYERNHATINLTKIRGAGSLAHEWWHAADHYLSRLDGKASSERIEKTAKDSDGKEYTYWVFDAKDAKTDYASWGFLYKSGMRQEMQDAIKGVMAAISKRKVEFTEDRSMRERVAQRRLGDIDKLLTQWRDGLAKEQSYGKKKAAATKEQLARFDAAAERLRKGDLGEMVNAPTKSRYSFRFYEPVMVIADLHKELRGRQAYGVQQNRMTGDAVRLQNALGVRKQDEQFLADAKAEKVKTKTVRTEYYSNSWALDEGRATDYWSTNHEMAARAFESFVYDRLKEIEARNDFLAYEKHNDLPEYRMFNVKPYPEGQERADINAAFEKLFDVMETTTNTDDGAVMLYQRPLDMFYSPLLKAVDSAKQKQAPAKDWKAIVAKLPGVKKAELEWLGVDEWLDAQEGQVSRDALVAFIRDSQIEIVEDRQYGDGQWAYSAEDAARFGTTPDEINDNPASFDQYTEDGGTNYREVLLRVPNLHESGKNAPKMSPSDQAEYDAAGRRMAEIEAEVGPIDIVPSDTPAGSPKWEWEAAEGKRRQIASRYEGKRPFVQSAHFEQENIVVHARVKDRTGPNGERVLFVEEIQSDLASKWRENSESPEVTARRQELGQEYARLRNEIGDLSDAAAERIKPDAGPGLTLGNISEDINSVSAVPTRDWSGSKARTLELMREREPELLATLTDLHDRAGDAQRELLALGTEKRMPEGTPDTPFQQEHTYNLMVKRLLRMAAEEGYDQLSWTPGYMQAERWNSAAQSVVEGVEWDSAEIPGYRYVTIQMASGGQSFSASVEPSGRIEGSTNRELEGKQLSSLVGPGLAKQIMTEQSGRADNQKITFPDSGYAIAYDQQTRKAVDKLVKKHGTSVRVDKSMPDMQGTLVSTGESDPRPVWSVSITPELREAAMQPMPMFRRGNTAQQTKAAIWPNLPELRAELDKMGLTDVNLQTVDPDSTYQGALRIDRKGGMTVLIGASLDPTATLRHEAIHALSAMDLFKTGEWRLLTQRAQRDWMAKHDIEARYPELSRLEQIEEAIAEEYAAWAKDGAKSGNGAFAKIKKFLEALGNMLRGQGFQTVEDVFGGVSEGVVGRRPVPEGLRDMIQRGNAMLFQEGKKSGNGIRAYHGSPHDFDRFSMDKIGTGEGAQAYGHGLYFAENEGVAKGYRDALSLDAGFSYKGKTGMTRDQLAEAIEADYGRGYLDNVSTPRAVADGVMDDLIYGASDRKLGPERTALREELRGAIGRTDPGSMYEVNINANPDDFLDWDAPLSEQPESVRALAQKAGVADVAPDWRFNGYDGGYFRKTENGSVKVGEVRHLGGNQYRAKVGRDELGTFSNPEQAKAAIDKALEAKGGASNALKMRGSDLYSRLAGGIDSLVSEPKNRIGATSVMSEAGIPGIKYRDAGSRGMDGDSGTRNFVVFDDSLVEVVRKYQRPPLNTAGREAIARGTNTPMIPDRQVFDEALRENTAILARASGTKGAIRDNLDAARLAIQDRMLPLRRAEEAVAELTGTVIDKKDSAYFAEERYSGRVGFRLDAIRDEFTNPIARLIGAAGKKLSLTDPKGETVTGADAADLYLWARHAKERNARISKINPSMGGPTLEDPYATGTGSGMSDDQADAIIAQAEKSLARKTYRDIGAMADKLGQDMIKWREDAGLLSKEEAAIWRAMYKHYVPLRGFAETDMHDAIANEVQIGSGGSKFGARGKESKTAMGRSSQAYSPLSTMLAMAEEVTVRAEKNLVARTLYNLAEKHPAPAMWRIKTPETKRYFNSATGTVETRVVDPASVMPKPNEVALKINGIEKRVELIDPGMARAMSQLGTMEMGAVTRFASMFSRLFSATNTMLSPPFVIVNAFRDMVTAQINLGQLPKEVRGKIRTAAVRDWVKSFGGSYSEMRGGGSSEYAQYFREFSAVGAKVSFWKIENPEARSDQLRKAVRRESGGILNQTFWKNATFDTDVNPVLNWIETVNLAVDNSVRLSVYVESRRQGFSIEDAASLSKNLTVNFNRRGEWGATMNAWFPFANAAVQGSHVLIKAMKAPQVQALLGGAVLTGFAMEFLNAALSEEDEDGELAHDKIPDYISQRNLIIPTGVESRVTIPLPYGYNVFFYAGQQMAKAMRGVKDEGMVIRDVTKATFGAFSPISGEGLAQTLMPTLGDHMMELATNKDWLGRPIRPEAPFGDYGPQAYKMFKNEPPAPFQFAADMLNKGTGGNELEPGLIDVSPEYLHHTFKFLTGGAGRFVSQVADITGKVVTGDGDLVEAHQVPLLRTLRYQPSEFLDQGRYFEFRTNVENARAMVEKRAPELGIDPRESLVQLSKLHPQLRAAERQRRAISERIGTIYADRTLSYRERRERLAPLEKQRQEVYIRFNRAYVEVMGPQSE